MPRMVSLTRHDYDGRTYERGDEFEAEHQFVPFLTITERAIIAQGSDGGIEDVAQASGDESKDFGEGTGIGYSTREMNAADEISSDSAARTKRQYKRKSA